MTLMHPGPVAVRDEGGPMIAVAQAALDAGLSPIPIRSDGTKRPAVRWKPYQSAPATADALPTMFAGTAGLGIVCGAVSGGLELLELEGRAVDEGVKDRFVKACADAGIGDVLERIIRGYAARSPGGGVHLVYRCADVAGNQKLARRPATAAELADTPADPVRVLIETRGEGGYFVAPPSNGTTHPTGRAWEQIHGGFATIATITPDERRALLDVARQLDQMPTVEPPAAAGVPPSAGTDDTPLGRYDRAHTCQDILTRNGFAFHHRDSKGDHYTRPGKDPRQGASATVWADNGTATLWSTAIAAAGEALDDRRNLRPSQLAAHLEHRGDFSAVARAQVDRERTAGKTAPAVDPDSFLLGATREPDGIHWTGTGDQELAATGWEAADIDTILAGEWKPETPTVGQVGDGPAALFYASRVNGLYGPPGAGKTWIADRIIADFLNAGDAALVIDYEDTAQTTVARLRALGVPDANIRRLVHISPTMPWGEGARTALAKMIDELSIAIAMIDSTGEALAEDGVQPNVDEEVARWFRSGPRWLARLGVTVLALDHVPKDTTSGTRGPIGSQRKLAAIDGAAYTVDAKVAPAKGRDGHLILICDKDRHGTWSKGTPVARVEVTSSSDGTHVAIAIDRHTKTDRPTVLMERISRHLEHIGGGLSGRDIESAVSGKSSGIRQALVALVDEGHVEKSLIDGKGGSHRFRAVRTFRADPGDAFGNRWIGDGPDPTASPASQPRPDTRDAGNPEPTASPASQPRPNRVPPSQGRGSATASPASPPSNTRRGSGDAVSRTTQGRATTTPTDPTDPSTASLAPDIPTEPQGI